MGKHINKKESQHMRRDSFLFIESKIGLQVVNAECFGVNVVLKSLEDRHS